MLPDAPSGNHDRAGPRPSGTSPEKKEHAMVRALAREPRTPLHPPHQSRVPINYYHSRVHSELFYQEHAILVKSIAATTHRQRTNQRRG